MIPKITQELIDTKGAKYWSCKDLMEHIGKPFKHDENGNYMLDPNIEYTEDEVIAIQNTVTNLGKRIIE